MKVYATENAAASAIRGILRTFTSEERLRIVSLATSDANIPDDERQRVLSALERAGNRVTGAAKLLGCSRRTLQRLMLVLDLRPGTDGRPTKRELRERHPLAKDLGVSEEEARRLARLV
jgi:hypothetical protein